VRRGILLGALLAFLAPAAAAQEPGAEGGAGLALRAQKILVCSFDGPQVVDDGLLLVEDGKIVDVGRAREMQVPAGYQVVDVGERWLAPGLIDLHCHEAGESLFSGVNDLNDMVYLANPEMRAAASVEPGNRALEMGIAGGVTTVLYIPGSGTNIGGQGILLKTAFDTFEESVVRNPGSMKLAQWGNPEAWAMGVGMAFENWNTRNTLRRGVAYAKRWQAHEEGEAPEPERNLMFDVFRDLTKGEIAISTHTQVYQVVLMTLTMVHGEFGLPVFLDHSEIGGWLAAPVASRMGVSAIIGPRSIDTPRRRLAGARRDDDRLQHGFTDRPGGGAARASRDGRPLRLRRRRAGRAPRAHDHPGAHGEDRRARGIARAR
jgi:hypothetical protein